MKITKVLSQNTVEKELKVYLDGIANWGDNPNVTVDSFLYKNRAPKSYSPSPAHYGFAWQNGKIIKNAFITIGKKLIGNKPMAVNGNLLDAHLKVPKFVSAATTIRKRLNLKLSWTAWRVVAEAFKGDNPKPFNETKIIHSDATFNVFIRSKIEPQMRYYFPKLPAKKDVITESMADDIKNAKTYDQIREILLADVIKPLLHK